MRTSQRQTSILNFLQESAPEVKDFVPIDRIGSSEPPTEKNKLGRPKKYDRRR